MVSASMIDGKPYHKLKIFKTSIFQPAKIVLFMKSSFHFVQYYGIHLEKRLI